MGPVRVSARIPGAPREVFAYVADTRNDPEWCHNVTDIQQVRGDGVAPGSRFRFHQSMEMRGRRLDSEVDVEVLRMGESSIEWQVEDRFQMRHVVLTVEPANGGSRVVQETTATFKRNPGLARWLYPLLARRTFREQFQALAERLADRP